MLIRVNVDAPDDKITEFGAGAKLYWARDNTSATGSFGDASGSVTLSPTTTQYEIIDTAGGVGHFYRTRVGNSGATLFDEWSEVFQAGAITSYATLDSLKEILKMPDGSRDNLLSDLLLDATAAITRECERDFFRHPAVIGEEIRIFDGSGNAKLRVDAGIISLSKVELATGTGQDFTELAATDWLYWPTSLRPDWSYTALRLSDSGSYSTWYRGYGNVRLTGVFGFAAIPRDIQRATLDLAREWYRQGPGGGGPVGVNQFGTPIFGGQIPQSVRSALANWNARHVINF